MLLVTNELAPAESFTKILTTLCSSLGLDKVLSNVIFRINV